MEKAIKWQSTTDLPANWEELINDELPELFTLKEKQAESQKDTEVFNDFNRKTERRWIIETGIIEELYYIDRSTSDKLVEQGFDREILTKGITDKTADEIMPIISDQEKALKWTYDFIAENRELSIRDIKELHRILTSSQYVIQKENLKNFRKNTDSQQPEEEKCEPALIESPAGEESATDALGIEETVNKETVEEAPTSEKDISEESPVNDETATNPIPPEAVEVIEVVEEKIEEEPKPEEEKIEKTPEPEQSDTQIESEEKPKEKIKVELERHLKSGIIEEAREKLESMLHLKGAPGEWKTESNDIVRADGTLVETCPPDQVHDEIMSLLKILEEIKKREVPPEIEAAWLLHRLLKIRPFHVGNHRVALCLSSMVFVKAGWFPLVIYRDSRYAYQDALEQADRGDLCPLVTLFSSLQKKTLLKLPGLTSDVLDPHQKLKGVIKSTAEKIRQKLKIDKVEISKVFEYANSLKDLAFNELEEISELITEELSAISAEFFAGVRMSDMSNNYYFHQEIIENAHKLNYYPNIREYREWVRLHIIEQRKTYMVISLHGYGRDFTGTMAASAFSYEKDEDEDGERRVINTHKICNNTFQFNYNEDIREIEHRFKEWLIESIATGLQFWKEDL